MIKLILIILLGIVYVGFMQPEGGNPAIAEATRQATSARQHDAGTIADAFAQQQSNMQVQGQGIVIRVLKDDNDGHRHQRFILRLADGHTVLIAHNIDLAPRLDALKTGDTVEFFGEYEWNSKGGVVHWTHHDPRNSHPNGWLKHHGNTYQ